MRSRIFSALMVAFVLSGASSACKETHRVAERRNKSVIVTYEQTGGFAAVHKSCQIDADTLSQQERERLLKLVGESGILSVKAKINQTEPRARDVFYYDISVTEKGKKHQVYYDDVTLPKTYRPLVTYLGSKCASVR